MAEIALAAPPADAAVAEAARRLAQPHARVDALAGDLGLSERQLRRRFHAAAGYGPKTLQRVLHFRRFLAAADRPRARRARRRPVAPHARVRAARGPHARGPAQGVTAPWM
jgi:transcriptional regulator GlxA family with amidase domain